MSSDSTFFVGLDDHTHVYKSFVPVGARERDGVSGEYLHVYG
jgi:hypothetical protein